MRRDKDREQTLGSLHLSSFNGKCMRKEERRRERRLHSQYVLTASHRVKESQKLAVSEDETKPGLLILKAFLFDQIIHILHEGLQELGSLPHMLSFSVL